MSKGEQTREMILGRAAQLFSRQGYFGSSLSDIMQVTGLEKGGIYNHFSSKENLALEAFDYALQLYQTRFKQALTGKTNTVDRLLAIVSVLQSIAEDPVLEGGCYVLNTSVESDDTMPLLRDRAQSAVNDWISLIERTVIKGKERGEIRLDVDQTSLATFLIATLEGAVMLTKLYNNSQHMRYAVQYLTHYIETNVKA